MFLRLMLRRSSATADEIVFVVLFFSNFDVFLFVHSCDQALVSALSSD